MKRGISLHIGLNYVDADVYGGPQTLGGCVNDANDLQSIASKNGYETNILLNEDATALNVLKQIRNTAEKLDNGDIFLLSYSGHGTPVQDTTNDEKDEFDEAWVLYDRLFLDDELSDLWHDFKYGVRIFVISDSCHSATMLKNFVMVNQMLPSNETRNFGGMNAIIDSFDNNVKMKRAFSTEVELQKRLLPAGIGRNVYMANKTNYEEIRYSSKGSNSGDPNASVILISGCQDDQYSYDTGINGVFTSKLIETWNSGNFRGTYDRFHNEVKTKVISEHSDQVPGIMKIGKNTDIFSKNIPFIINAPGWPATAQGNSNSDSSSGISGADTSNDSAGSSSSHNNGLLSTPSLPSITVPSVWNVNNGVPEFSINKGSNEYYYLEIVNDELLFNYNYYFANGNSNNSFFTWNDTTVNNRLTSSSFKIPIHIWNKLKNNDELIIRIGSTSSSGSAWDNHLSGAELATMEITNLVSNLNGSSPNSGLPTSSGSTSTNNSETGGTSNGNNNEGGSTYELQSSVGPTYPNRRKDVLMVQELLNLVSRENGGPSSTLIEDGKFGTNTKNSIRRFQRINDLNKTSFIEPGDTTFILLKIKSGVARICK